MVTMKFSVGDTEFLHEFAVVEELAVACILGTDFFVRHGMAIDFARNCLQTASCVYPFRLSADKPRLCRLVLSQPEQFNAGQEKVVHVRLQRRVPSGVQFLGIVESERRVSNEQMVARSVQMPDGDGRLAVRVLNTSGCSLSLRKGSRIGWFSPVAAQQPAGWQVNSVESVRDDWNPLSDVKEWGGCGLTGDEKHEFERLMARNRDVFARDSSELGQSHLMAHEIDTGNAKPVSQPARRIPPRWKEEIDKQVDELLQQDRIYPCYSPWASPIVPVKKADGSLRLCLDYRRLNEVTVPDPYPPPRMDETLDALGGNCVFSTMDLASGYHQCPIEPKDQLKTAFVVPNRGQFAWKCMSFGLRNAPATFARLMSMALSEVNWKECLVYFDDIVVFAKSVGQHLERLKHVFQCLRDANVKLKPAKCVFLAERVKFLGHIVSQEGIATDPSKCEEIQNWPRPCSAKKVQAFLGTCAYYQSFIPQFSEIAAPLYRLTADGVKFEWGSEEESSFCRLKDALCSPNVMAFPDFSPGAGEFILDTDASSRVGLGAVLSQRQADGREKVIAYGSRMIHAAEKNYCTTRLELLAVVHFVKKYRYYLLGRKFTVRSDHKALQWLASLKDVEGQCARWLESLQNFDFEIIHRPGKEHGNADSLSRKYRKHAGHESCPSCQFSENVPVVNAVFGSGLSSKEVQQAQVAEKKLAAVRSYALDPGSNPSAPRVMSWEERVLWAQRQLIRVESDLLYFQSPGSGCQKKILLPPALLPKVLSELHDGVAGGHLGVRKTQEKVKARYWWPGLSRSVEEYCRSCVHCAKAKPGRSNRAPLQPICSEGAFQRIMSDIVGPLPKSRGGNRFVLTIQDSFTKWPVAVPLSNQRAPTVARAIFDHWIAHFGCPEFLVTDKGTNFESALMKQLCRLLAVKKCRTSSYHPMADGQAESFNKTLKSMIKCRMSESVGEGDWEDLIHPSLMAYRSSVHRGTGYTPYYMLYAREMRLPVDIGTLPESIPASAPAYVQSLGNSLAEAHSQVRTNLQQYQRKQKVLYDSRVRGPAIEVGDAVLEYSPALQAGEAAKFHCNWKGPAKVLEKISDLNYRVKHANRGKSKIVHYNNLRKVPERPEQFRLMNRHTAVQRRSAHPPEPAGCRQEPAGPATKSRNLRRRRSFTRMWCHQLPLGLGMG
ncbi:hypothetical protein BOX15_Mlig033284g14 [Macrostomum lignano]|uniref:RNA-directed DNA polymerase n=1 Tax=Macrostomum lignano TaxID=282301 RepID=A0A267G917_9PLAT|nr:hypothetical protein BOX15_Mlig033284g14 [Macrostomum lignano]